MNEEKQSEKKPPEWWDQLDRVFEDAVEKAIEETKAIKEQQPKK